MVDDRVNRGSSGKNQSLLTSVNAWASYNRLLLGRFVADAKSNEIKAVPKLLKGLVQKAIVAVEALIRQKEKEAVIEGGGDYAFALKVNQSWM